MSSGEDSGMFFAIADCEAKPLKAVSVERDQLRALRDDLDDLLESCEAAAAGIEDAIDALSRHV